MKEAIITDLDGYMERVTLVADNVAGVLPILHTVQDPEEELGTLDDPKKAGEPEEHTEPEVITIGYTVAIRPPEGLYKLRYDLEAYRAATEQYEKDMDEWRDEIQHRTKEDGDFEYPSPPASPDLSQFWVEGYTEEQLRELLHNQSSAPSILGVSNQESHMDVSNQRKGRRSLWNFGSWFFRSSGLTRKDSGR